MEIEGKNGWRTELRKGSMEFGRGLGFPATDRTVSRRHVSVELLEGSETRVRFEVIGKNPIWVLNSGSGDIRVFRRHQRGEMESGDSFCVSSKNPIWFSMKSIEFPEVCRCGSESLGVSDIDPVKEFGFIVMGHEFDSYPKQMIRDVKNWNWFVEEPCKDSEDDEVYGKKRGTRGKRKQAENNDDDDWTGESHGDKEMVARIRKNQRPKYSTRSKDNNKTLKDTVSSKTSTKKASGDDKEYEDEDNDETEDEDTLGGFIVNDDQEEEEEESDVEEEEEEEEEDYDEDEDEDDGMDE